MLLLGIEGPHFENHCIRVVSHEPNEIRFQPETIYAYYINIVCLSYSLKCYNVKLKKQKRKKKWPKLRY